jgi:hypothetical protein
MTMRLTLVLLSLFSFGLTGQVCADSTGTRIVHVVLVWLKEPGNLEHRASVIDATRGFADIPGVTEVRVGEPVPSERSTVDGSYDVGLYMIFRSRAALDTYLDHPTHKEAQRAVLRPLVRKVIVYDFEDDGR